MAEDGSKMALGSDFHLVPDLHHRSMWRTVPRRPISIALSAGGCCTPRRPLHVSLPRAQVYPPRGPGFYARLRFRKDGTPRSRLMGAFLGFSLLFNVLLLRALVELVENEEETESRLPNIIHLLRIDEEYATVDLDDPVATLEYFNRMVLAVIPSGSADTVEAYLGFLLNKLRSQGEKDPTVKIHGVLRSSVERIHQILVEPDLIDHPYTQRFVGTLEIMQEAIQSCSDMISDPDNEEEDGGPIPSLHDLSKQDTQTAASDYESLG